MKKLDKIADASQRATQSNAGFKPRSRINSTNVSSRGVQTDFPFHSHSSIGEIETKIFFLHRNFMLLESYVTKNRSRILSLLNISEPQKTPCDSPSLVSRNGIGDPQVGSSVSSPLLSNGNANCSASIYNERRMAVTDF